jgi:mannose-6-phosphate isomerase-like protein (cupin superfamily)
MHEQNSGRDPAAADVEIDAANDRSGGPTTGSLDAGLSSVLVADKDEPQGERNQRHGREERMKGFVADIEELTKKNGDFRRVLYTGHNLQLVLMTLQPGEEIGSEVHVDRDQFFRIEEGEGEVWIDGVCNKVKDDDAVIVPQGARHNVVNPGSEPLRLYTIYGPPEHVDGIVHRTKAEADAGHEHFDGRTTE